MCALTRYIHGVDLNRRTNNDEVRMGPRRLGVLGVCRTVQFFDEHIYQMMLFNGFFHQIVAIGFLLYRRIHKSPFEPRWISNS